MAVHGPLKRPRVPTGEGVPLVLLPAFPLDLRMWADVAALVPAGRTVLAVDPPGLGASAAGEAVAAPSAPASVPTRLRAVPRGRRRRRRCDPARARDRPRRRRGAVDGRLHGPRARRAAPRRGRRTRAARHPVDAGRRRRAREPPPGRRRRPGRGRPDRARRDAARPARGRAPRAGRPPRPRHRLGRRAGAGRCGVVPARDGGAARPHPVLAGVTVPALVLVGATDEITPVPAAEHMAAALSDVELVVVPRAGHLTSVEAPGRWSRPP